MGYDQSRPTLALRVGASRGTARLVGGVLCLVLGAGLLGGSVAGAWLTDDQIPTAAEVAYDDARALWREVPVDELFPAELMGPGAGPGGADRRWLRVGVAPDSDCAQAFDRLLGQALAPVGCHRLLRATYVDETETTVTTVGMLFTEADRRGMREFRGRFAAEELATRTGRLPRPYAVPGTAAERFGEAQRGSWTVRVLTSVPVVVFAVTGFSNGRVVAEPEPAPQATEEGRKTTLALAGLGHDTEGVADRVERGLRRAADRIAGERQ